MTVKGIKDGKYTTSDYIILLIFFKGKLPNSIIIKSVLAGFTREITIVNDFKANLLLGIDYLIPEKFNIIISKGYVQINSY